MILKNKKIKKTRLLPSSSRQHKAQESGPKTQIPLFKKLPWSNLLRQCGPVLVICSSRPSPLNGPHAHQAAHFTSARSIITILAPVFFSFLDLQQIQTKKTVGLVE